MTKNKDSDLNEVHSPNEDLDLNETHLYTAEKFTKRSLILQIVKAFEQGNWDIEIKFPKETFGISFTVDTPFRHQVNCTDVSLSSVTLFGTTFDVIINNKVKPSFVQYGGQRLEYESHALEVNLTSKTTSEDIMKLAEKWKAFMERKNKVITTLDEMDILK